SRSRMHDVLKRSHRRAHESVVGLNPCGSALRGGGAGVRIAPITLTRIAHDLNQPTSTGKPSPAESVCALMNHHTQITRFVAASSWLEGSRYLNMVDLKEQKKMILRDAR